MKEMNELTISPAAYLPEFVKVGPITYQVIVEPCPTVVDEEGNERTVFGLVNFKKAEIRIDQELAPALQWQCLFHEILHIFFETLGFEDPGEGQIDAMSYLLMDLLIDNMFVSGMDFLALESIDRIIANREA
jgi:hypothetical protein